MKVKLLVNFLVRHEDNNTHFLWPKKDDRQTVKKSDVLFVLSHAPIAATREHYCIPEREAIDLLLQQKGNVKKLKSFCTFEYKNLDLELKLTYTLLFLSQVPPVIPSLRSMKHAVKEHFFCKFLFITD